jgi:hypothetical protein
MSCAVGCFNLNRTYDIKIDFIKKLLYNNICNKEKGEMKKWLMYQKKVDC